MSLHRPPIGLHRSGGASTDLGPKAQFGRARPCWVRKPILGLATHFEHENPFWGQKLILGACQFIDMGCQSFDRGPLLGALRGAPPLLEGP